MECHWIYSSDGKWHWGYLDQYPDSRGYAVNHCLTFSNLDHWWIENIPRPYTIILVAAALVALLFLSISLYRDFYPKLELPEAPDPFDETKHTIKQRQNRRQQAPIVECFEWNVVPDGNSVAVYLRFSVEELKIIQRFGLQGVECETTSMYSPEELQEIRERHEQEEAGVADAYKREFLRMAHEEAFERYKAAILSVTLGDYIGDYPYVRVFPTTLGATAYADFLEKDVIPKIQQELEKRMPKDDEEEAA